MTVKKAVLAAATELGIVDEVQAYIDGTSEEGQKQTELLLHCFNIVENELALDYLPLQAEDTFSTNTGVISYQQLLHSAVRILRVTNVDGESVKFFIYPEYLKTQPGEVKVVYTYTPKTKTLTEESDFVLYVSSRLFAYGMAAEYALATGLYEEAAIWDKKYKEAIEATYRTAPCKRIQSRRWV